jgi:hypothetical protein
MVSNEQRKWHELSDEERPDRLREILADLEARRREGDDEAARLQTEAVFCATMLGTRISPLS